MENEQKKSNRGGRRVGAGRKLENGVPKIHKDVSLDEETIDILKEFGEGNLSEGIRRAAVLANIKMLVG